LIGLASNARQGAVSTIQLSSQEDENRRDGALAHDGRVDAADQGAGSAL
jgi:hypothetical protein